MGPLLLPRWYSRWFCLPAAQERKTTTHPFRDMDSARHIDLNMGRPAEATCYRQKLINRADGAVHVIIIYNVCGYYLVSDSYAKWNWNYYITIACTEEAHITLVAMMNGCEDNPSSSHDCMLLSGRND